MYRTLIALTLVLAACQQTPEAQNQQAGQAGASVVVTDVWARATAPGQATGALYLTIDNPGATADELVALSTDRAATAMVHETRTENGLSRMRMLERLAIPAGATVELRPGGTHVMLDGTEPMSAGETFDLELRFARAGAQVVPVTVVEPGAR
ncbi:copper chaperone PCu(A)C [Sphingomonas xanthus]|uniref:Copper chaperone PCu(A)C n=1 Tax=Sphingomonas xanthus TaxID=2594473 RepID=A0A516ISZ5_9SPHN|nr:copper chaperone PCu(A)C [Sphingomonas xanthus]QDP20005.1 copper chaperone PCu(A)C [Sphingomonas xanthus]